MICQPNNWNMLQMLEKLSAQVIYYWPRADVPTDIANTGYNYMACRDYMNLEVRSL